MTTEAREAPLHLRLRMSLPQLRESERKVARVLLAQPADASRKGIVNLARSAGVSEGTVVRLCRALGFRGFTDFKVHFIADLAASDPRAHPAAMEDAGDGIKQDDDIAAIARKIFHMDMQALADTLLVLDTARIEVAVQAIAAAQRVEVFGAGASSLIAQDAAYRFMRVGVTALGLADPDLQVIHASLLGEDDVAIAISHSGETRNTIDALALAAETRARTIAITNFPHSTLARLADITLATSVPEAPWPGDAVLTRIVQMSLVDTLCVATFMRKEGDAVGRIQKIDKALERKKGGCAVT